ncbi:petrobactin biosynthesis protein AsbE [Paenibacillus curdlanolyticus YK9]|uniref:Petrobactin biosynthesis protein AsbE n=1 Tax=Paenibacillus curdlanolyticus YK9 TaxID=717606 RepID=E0IAY8_9BACL|nr:DUF6005 family protein [Paenibacillus curdlanolyticus]EFM10279.1 petrobactin biosynthesis protein AsbE [Paenibacillus curdlanolyticus YK9]
MIKVHCLVSCFCEIIKRRAGGRADHRPFYFGVWDSDFDVTEEGRITYYSARTDHDHFVDWYRAFFGVGIREWYDFTRNAEHNWQLLLNLLDNKTEDQYVVVQIDMSMLPERENKFAAKPFPHFLMLSKTDNEDEWFMFDPDFRWEGNLPKERIKEAFLHNEYGGGYVIDAGRIENPSPDVIAGLYEATMRKDENELVSRLRDIVVSMAEGRGGRTLDTLLSAVQQLNILVIRKYSYDYALMFFRDRLGLSEDNYERWCQEIRDLVQAFHTVQYMCVKLSMTKDLALLPDILGHLDRADAIEFSIKSEIDRQYRMWKQAELAPGERIRTVVGQA